MKAVLRQVRVTPKKAALIAKLVMRKSVNEALDILKFTRRKPALIIKKVIESAIANATNNTKQARENLFIKEIVVTEGPTYKRGIPISRGRMHPILKRTSHINVSLEAKAGSPAPKARKAKAVEAKTEPTEVKETTVKTK